MKSTAIVRLQAVLVAELKAICAARTRELVASALGRIGPAAKARRKAPIQLCPAPACTNRAAPCYGMLCAPHKDTDKATVRAWREQRRAAKGR